MVLRDTGLPVIIVTHTGNKTGAISKTPLMRVKDDASYVLVGSQGGAPTNPDWYHNLVANPEVTVEIPGETFSARARVAEGEERDRLYRAQADVMPNFDEYAKNSDAMLRVIRKHRAAVANIDAAVVPDEGVPTRTRRNGPAGRFSESPVSPAAVGIVLSCSRTGTPLPNDSVDASDAGSR